MNTQQLDHVVEKPKGPSRKTLKQKIEDAKFGIEVATICNVPDELRFHEKRLGILIERKRVEDEEVIKKYNTLYEQLMTVACQLPDDYIQSAMSVFSDDDDLPTLQNYEGEDFRKTGDGNTEVVVKLLIRKNGD